MTKLPKIVPALGLAGALLFATGVAANAQEVAPAATLSPVNAQSNANLIPAAFHGGGGNWGHGGGGDWRHGGGHWRRGWGYGPLFGFYDGVAPDYYAYGGGCGFYHLRWQQTGLGVWRRRYYECVYG